MFEWGLSFSEVGTAVFKGEAVFFGGDSPRGTCFFRREALFFLFEKGFFFKRGPFFKSVAFLFN